jgi:hypothetical protein
MRMPAFRGSKKTLYRVMQAGLQCVEDQLPVASSRSQLSVEALFRTGWELGQTDLAVAAARRRWWIDALQKTRAREI